MQSGCPDTGCHVCHWLVRIKISFCAGLFGMPINVRSTAKLRNKRLKRNAEYDVVSGGHTIVDISCVCSGCDVIHHDVTRILIVARRLLLGMSVKGCDKKVSSSWWTLAIFVPPEMSTKRVVWWPHIFFTSWIWFTRISLMVHICDKKMCWMSYLFRYFHEALIPIMTAVTYEENLAKKRECLYRNVR